MLSQVQRMKIQEARGGKYVRERMGRDEGPGPAVVRETDLLLLI